MHANSFVLYIWLQAEIVQSEIWQLACFRLASSIAAICDQVQLAYRSQGSSGEGLKDRILYQNECKSRCCGHSASASQMRDVSEFGGFKSPLQSDGLCLIGNTLIMANCHFSNIPNAAEWTRTFEIYHHQTLLHQIDDKSNGEFRA